MDAAKSNPPTNILGLGINEQMVTDAILSSGYPLQLAVATLLSPRFRLQEEWSYPDTDTSTIRTIDIVATLPFQWSEPQPRARPALTFVIECKQSDLPYVFFLSETQPWLREFPLIAGLAKDIIHITSDDDPSSWQMRPIDVFDLRRHEFSQGDVPCGMTFSKCVRKGRELILSDSDAYQGIVFPITKAMQHLKVVRKPPSTAHYFDCEMIIGLAVIDAPLVGVRVASSNLKTELMPWFRIVRHHPTPGKHESERSQVFGIDVVHKEFLKDYIDRHAVPFAERFADLAIKHHNVLADARGFVSGMRKEWRSNFEARLETAGVIAAGKRVKASFRVNRNSP